MQRDATAPVAMDLIYSDTGGYHRVLHLGGDNLSGITPEPDIQQCSQEAPPVVKKTESRTSKSNIER